MITSIINPSNEIISVTLFPNPFHVSAVLRTNRMSREFKIYNSLGILVRSESLNNESTIINRGSLADGIYFYQLITNDRQMTTGKFVIE